METTKNTGEINKTRPRGFYVKTSRDKYILNFTISFLIAFLTIFLTILSHSINTLPLHYFIIFLGVLFFSFRFIEYLLTGKTVSRLFYVEEGKSAFVYGAVYLILLLLLIYTVLVGGLL